jgi:hypothetical protein
MQRAFTHLEHRWGIRPGKGKRPVRALTIGLVLWSLLLAGCSSKGSTAASTVGKAGGDTSAQGFSAPDRSSSANSGAPEARQGAPAAAAPGLSNGSAKPAKPSAARLPKVGTGAKLTRSASLDLKVANIETAAARVRALAAGLRAQILSEQIGKGDPGEPTPVQGGTRQPSVPGVSGSSGDTDATNGFGTLTLSVPADKLDAALDQLARIGTVLGRNTSSEDVTSQLVDIESRLKTMRASVERVRALMAKATNLGQVVALEGELSRRESDLESLESQLSALKGNVERSTVTVSLSTPGDESVTQAGFGTGLAAGWDAFISSAGGLATALGAALPFALLIAVLGAPLVLWWRRRRQPSAQPVSEA